MAVSDLELKCYEYLFAIRDIQKLSGMGIYGMDAQRERIHDEIIKLSGLSRDEMCDITDNMPGGINGTDLYFLLKDRKKELRK